MLHVIFFFANTDCSDDSFPVLRIEASLCLRSQEKPDRSQENLKEIKYTCTVLCTLPAAHTVRFNLNLKHLYLQHESIDKKGIQRPQPALFHSRDRGTITGSGRIPSTGSLKDD